MEYGTSLFDAETITSATPIAGITNFAEASPNGGDDFSGEVFNLTSNITARYIKLNVDSNFPTADGGFVGLSEIQFNQVPEPGSLALLGLGGLLIASRRRRG